MFGGVVGVVVAVRVVDVWVKWTKAQGAAWWAAAVGLVAAGKVVWAVEELLWVWECLPSRFLRLKACDGRLDSWPKSAGVDDVRWQAWNGEATKVVFVWWNLGESMWKAAEECQKERQRRKWRDQRGQERKRKWMKAVGQQNVRVRLVAERGCQEQARLGHDHEGGTSCCGWRWRWLGFEIDDLEHIGLIHGRSVEDFRLIRRRWKRKIGWTAGVCVVVWTFWRL
jgi:hypothetical protein